MTSKPKTYTALELRRAQRDAFVEGAAAAMSHFGLIPYQHPAGTAWPGAKVLAFERYPVPRHTRPRVVTDGYHNAYRIHEGNLEMKKPEGPWYHILHVSGTSTLLKDLLADPTEVVDDDDA